MTNEPTTWNETCSQAPCNRGVVDSGSPEADARDRVAAIGFAETERRLAAANERCAELAAGLDRLRKNALEMAGYVKSYGLDDVGPQSEWSRYSQCRSNIENVADCATILAAVREKARLAGAVGALKDLLLWREIEGSTSDLLWFTELKIRIAALEAKG